MSPGSRPSSSKKRGGAPRPSRRRLEGGLRRLRDRDDGVLPRHVAGRPEQGDQERRRRLLPRSRHLRPAEVGRTDRRRRSRSIRSRAGAREARALGDDAEERAALEETAKRIRQRLAESPDLRSLGKQIEIQVTRDGLRIELVDADQTTFFASGSAALAAGTEKVLAADRARAGRAEELDRHRRPHRLPALRGDRHLLELGAVGGSRQRRAPGHGARRPDGGQVRGVRGYADRQLRVGDAPLDPRNRRVSVIVVHNS